MAMVNILLPQRTLILYFLIILCLMSYQLLVQSQQVKISTVSQGKKNTVHSRKIVYKRGVPIRNVPTRNVILDRNSYVALLYLAGFSVCIICLIFFPKLTRKPYQYIKVIINAFIF